MRYGVTEDYDYNATHKRHRLILWSGDFMSSCEGAALSTPAGYIITRYYGNEQIRVSCPSPRDEDNFNDVDAALNLALWRADAPALVEAANRHAAQAETAAAEGMQRAASSWALNARRIADDAARLAAHVATVVPPAEVGPFAEAVADTERAATLAEQYATKEIQP